MVKQGANWHSSFSEEQCLKHHKGGLTHKARAECGAQQQAVRACVCVTCTGKFPAAVSPESMTQSEPSSTALATSVASALVGRGFFTMDSSIWVAVITGFPACIQHQQSLNQSVNQSIHPSIHPCIHPSIHPSICISVLGTHQGSQQK